MRGALATGQQIPLFRGSCGPLDGAVAEKDMRVWGRGLAGLGDGIALLLLLAWTSFLQAPGGKCLLAGMLGAPPEQGLHLAISGGHGLLRPPHSAAQRLSFLPSELPAVPSLPSCVAFVQSLDTFNCDHLHFPNEGMSEF